MEKVRKALRGFLPLLGIKRNGRGRKTDQPMAPGPSPRADLLALIESACVAVDLEAVTKEGAIEELVDLLEGAGKLQDRRTVLADLFQREEVMSTGMQHGIALPHAKSDGTKKLCVAVGIKKSGLDFESIDGEPSRIFILVVSPKNVSGPHVQFLAAIGSILKDPETRDRLLRAGSGEEVVACLRAELPADRAAEPTAATGRVGS
jgi:mannitol/fructose-specific phosphotransferase system IIA component (Ntr-type)